MHRAGGRALRLHPVRQAKDTRQGGHPARPAETHLRRQAAGRGPHAAGLQHPEGSQPAPRAQAEGGIELFICL